MSETDTLLVLTVETLNEVRKEAISSSDGEDLLEEHPERGSSIFESPEVELNFVPLGRPAEQNASGWKK